MINNSFYGHDSNAKSIECIDKAKGQVFNIGSGMENSPPLLELFIIAEELIEVKLQYTQLPMSKNEQRVFVADLTKTQQLLMWKPRITSHEGVTRLTEWMGW